MKRILLISNYFTPCTLTPSQRITFWAKNLHQLGYFPIVITREWNSETRSHQVTKLPLGKHVRHEVFETHEVYYLPFRPGMLDKAYLAFGESALRPLFYLVKLLDVFLVRFTLKLTSFSNFLPFIKAYLSDKKIHKIVISGEPFYLFKIGYYLKKELDSNWIADYRDDWTTNELQNEKSGGPIRKWIARVEAIYEKKWVGTAESIISVSSVYTGRISKFLDKKGYTIENGFEEELFELKKEELYPIFTLTFSGVLYPSQDLSLIFKALQLAILDEKPFQLIFLGSGFDVKQIKRIEEGIPREIQPYVKITDRLPRSSALVELQKSHAFLSMAYGNLKGIPSSKLYEYMALGKPILICPSDSDVMEQMVAESGLGFIANSAESCYGQILRIVDLYSNGEIEELRKNSQSKISRYSRFNQLLQLKEVLGD
ncbi:hypothetical protein JYB64_11645 [Algoriphagus aestuarii]|nr:hypothetical protein [Algoriphagus aestuarii]